MDEINNAVQRTMSRQEEKTQLIRNIIKSEIAYFDWKQELEEDISDERRQELIKYIASDDQIVATWKANFNITDQEIAAVRDEVLFETIVEKEQIFDKEEADIKDAIESLTKQLAETPIKKQKMTDKINSLRSVEHIYE